MDKKEAFRKEIIRLSGKIFSAKGYQKTSMQDIARSLNKAKSSIYYYFAGKEDILKAVVEKEVDLFRGQLYEAIDKTGNPIQEMESYIAARMQLMSLLVAGYKSLRDEYLNNIAFVEKIRKRYDLEEIELIRTILQKGVDQNYFQIFDVELGAQGIFTALKGMELRLFTYNKSSELSQRLENIIQIILYGIVKREN